MQMRHVAVEPSILYFGTPVVLISTLNEDGTANLAPMSSAWWLGWRCMLGLGVASKTPQNLLRTGECVLNLPSVDQACVVDALARLTGTKEVPEKKRKRGYVYEPRKFEIADVTPIASETVHAPGVLECPVRMEAVYVARHDMMGDDSRLHGISAAYEVRVTRVHVHPGILLDGHQDHIDPVKWKPLIMSFQKFFGLAEGEVLPSRLAQIDELLYRTPDVERAREAYKPEA